MAGEGQGRQADGGVDGADGDSGCRGRDCASLTYVRASKRPFALGRRRGFYSLLLFGEGRANSYSSIGIRALVTYNITRPLLF